MNFGGTIRLNPLGLCIVFGAFLLILFYTFSGDEKHEDIDTATINLKTLLIAAIEVAEKGGRAVKAARLDTKLDIESKGKTKEGVNDPVTNADFKSHCIMYHTLLNKFPKLKVISEEHPKNTCPDTQNLGVDSVGVVGADLQDLIVPTEEVTVWIDPLDATKEFTENLVQYVTTMVCVAVKGVPVIGVIHSPFGNARTNWAWVGNKMSSDLRYIVTKPPEKDEAVIVVVSRSHAGQVKNISEAAFGPNTKVVSAAGAGYKVLEVIQGGATVYLHVTAIKKWDVCAGNAILLALGGSLTDIRGNVLDYSAHAPAMNEKGIFATLKDPKPFLRNLENFQLP